MSGGDRGPFALGDTSAGTPWWVEAVVEPLGFLVLPGVLWVAGSVPEGVAGPFFLAGFGALASGSSLAAFARHVRETRGPTSRIYRQVGSASIMLLGVGLAGLMVGSVLFFGSF